MTLWKVEKYYDNNDNVFYDVAPYSLKGHLYCCWKWYGWKGLKNCYLFYKQAVKRANKLNKRGR